MYKIAIAVYGNHLTAPHYGKQEGIWVYEPEAIFDDLDDALEEISTLSLEGCERRGIWGVFDEDGNLEEKRDTSCDHNH